MLAHDPGAFVAAIDWTPILVAIITLCGVIFNGCAAVWITTRLSTPSGTSVGKQVENTHHITIANRHLLVRLSRELGLKADDPKLAALVELAEDVPPLDASASGEDT